MECKALISYAVPKGKFCFMPANFIKCVFSQFLLNFRQVIHNTCLQNPSAKKFVYKFLHFLLAGITFFATINSVLN